jgi:hypothetical protein
MIENRKNELTASYALILFCRRTANFIFAKWEDKMPQSHNGLCSKIKKYALSLVWSPLLIAGSAWAAQPPPALRLLNSLPIPVSALNLGTGTFSFDISFVDQSTGVYYLADRSNFAVDVVSAESIVTQIFPTNGHAPFAGFTPCAIQPAGANDCAGPNGVVAAFPWLFVTDAPSRVLSFDLRTNPPTGERVHYKGRRTNASG